MLELHDIHTYYGPVKAVDGISIKIGKGEIVSLIGSNGAGKTTTLMTIAGALKPAKGRIIFKGEDITSMPPHRIIQRGITLVPEGRRVFPRLTVIENLEMGAFRRKPHPSDFEEVFDLFPVLKERRNQIAGTLSGGEQQMLAIGRALMSKPELIMFDEPSLGLAPLMVVKIFMIIKRINENGITVLLVEQNAMQALKLSHRAYVIEGGVIKMEGKGSELLNNEELRRAYLGG